ncbi:hypothetical protein F1721_22545 [Saccharopolyspora hirsuta]|uniref:Erythromycin biosynthesis protein CIII-like C-terminal domain-containing protein n=1 Tax=Saccharopolyspora hirsuta TaxID=1837 RepID=A0A5M7BWB4_SACHI|nr:nucleotide disphospho-sugar-binding domain-containing protein [Saccharopolyspora hirsuta]KAA5830635.1 hypothetical protein F1721_22545 [Saccharopolyspora hirsuta]
MTRYLLMPYPQHGHVRPMVAIAAELLARGEDVLVATTPGFAAQFRQIGCTVEEFEAGVSNASVQLRGGLARFAGALSGLRRARQRRRQLLARIARSWPRWRPDAVLVDYVLGIGVLSAELAGTPYAVLNVTYALNAEVVAADTRRRFGPAVAGLISALGLLRWHPALRMPGADAPLALVNVLPELQPMRWSFDGRFRFVGPLRRDSGEFQEFHEVDLPWERIRSGRTLYVSAGTVFTRDAEFFRKVAWAFGGSEWFVVMATSHTDPAELGELPENVVARRYVPQSAVLEHCSAFITHGGMNSALEGLALRIPMVVVPSAGDQITTARRLSELGVGEVLSPDAGVADIRGAVTRVVGDERVHTALRALSERARATGGPAAAADALEEVATSGAIRAVRGAR